MRFHRLKAEWKSALIMHGEQFHHLISTDLMLKSSVAKREFLKEVDYVWCLAAKLAIIFDSALSFYIRDQVWKRKGSRILIGTQLRRE